MLPLPTTPWPRITTTLKRSSTTLQPTLSRAATPTSQSTTVRKRSRLKKKGVVNCSALSVINCIHLNFYIEFRIKSIIYFYLLICLLIFNINIYKHFKLISFRLQQQATSKAWVDIEIMQWFWNNRNKFECNKLFESNFFGIKLF